MPDMARNRAHEAAAIANVGRLNLSLDELRNEAVQRVAEAIKSNRDEMVSGIWQRYTDSALQVLTGR